MAYLGPVAAGGWGRAGVWLGLALSTVCLGVFAWDADWPAIARALGAMDRRWVLLAVPCLLATLLGRALRWGPLLGRRQIAPLRHRLGATAIGFMGNNLLPGRLGEPLRALVLSARAPRVTFGGAVGSLVVERVCDLVAAVVALAVFLLWVSGGALGPAIDRAHLDRLAAVGWLAAAAALAAVAVLLAVARRGGGGPGDDARATRVGRALRRLARHFRTGVAGLDSAAAIGRAGALTALVWGAMLLFDFCMLRALGAADLGLGHALGLLVVLSFAVALPQGPAAIGVFQVASEQTLTALYGVPSARAKAFALALWVCQVGVIVTAGALALWCEGLGLGDVRRAASPSPRDRRAGCRGC